ncbi:recombinase family protein [Fluviispira multicolorata]|uniref:Resolvase/invertase-type recombinase catalytic domain-containing protein n=1 Tax=Fluviispira multicolorata TaxID=2654512 RepID=A0A833N619_9BACT|nr:recombinase family protein [Fluviispira multicolorata]KAB8031989.1 hypothetical protein GCL57_04905 [Fluviispira multicolorata]
MKVAIYSKNDSYEHKMPQKQKSRLHNYALQRGWKIINEFEDYYFSEKRQARERDKLMQLAKEKEIDVVLVWSLKCWTASTRDLILSLDELSQYGVSFVSLSEPLDSLSPAGKTFSEILTAFAKFEKESSFKNNLSTPKSTQIKNSQNKRLGKALKCADEMKRLQKEGKNHSEIARALNVSRSSVHNILGNTKKKAENNRIYKKGEAQTLFCKSFYNVVNFLTYHSRMSIKK